jgi:hypothetical protein
MSSTRMTFSVHTAVLRHLGDWSDDIVEQGAVFYTGRFQEWDVAVVETGPGNRLG